MIAQNQAQQLIDGGAVVGSDGENIGKIGQVFLDNQSGNVSWVTVKTGWFGAGQSFVPTDDATLSGDTLTVPYGKDKIKGAPHFEADQPLSEQDEDQLYSYYGLGTTAPAGDYATTSTHTDTTVGDDTAVAGRNTGGEVTRSEEQVRVGTEKVQAGRARLRKYVTTEQQTVTVPVSHEEVRLEREPIAEGDRDAADAEIGEAEQEVVLTAERPVVEKDVVAVEKVRLGTETVTEQQQVSADVRKEQIELAGEGAAEHIADTGNDPAAR